jgi:hypothetical protein
VASAASSPPGYAQKARNARRSSGNLARTDAVTKQPSPTSSLPHTSLPLTSFKLSPQELQPLQQDTGGHVHGESCGNNDPDVKKQQEGYVLDYIRRRRNTKAALFKQQVRTRAAQPLPLMSCLLLDCCIHAALTDELSAAQMLHPWSQIAGRQNCTSSSNSMGRSSSCPCWIPLHHAPPGR